MKISNICLLLLYSYQFHLGKNLGSNNDFCKFVSSYSFPLISDMEYYWQQMKIPCSLVIFQHQNIIILKLNIFKRLLISKFSCIKLLEQKLDMIDLLSIFQHQSNVIGCYYRSLFLQSEHQKLTCLQLTVKSYYVQQL